LIIYIPDVSEKEFLSLNLWKLGRGKVDLDFGVWSIRIKKDVLSQRREVI